MTYSESRHGDIMQVRIDIYICKHPMPRQLMKLSLQFQAPAALTPRKESLYLLLRGRGCGTQGQS